jgi:hypothetical protein
MSRFIILRPAQGLKKAVEGALVLVTAAPFTAA